MKAINYYIVVSDIKEEEKKIAGLIFTEKTDVDNRYTRAKIISKGNSRFIQKPFNMEQLTMEIGEILKK